MIFIFITIIFQHMELNGLEDGVLFLVYRRVTIWISCDPRPSGLLPNGAPRLVPSLERGQRNCLEHK